MTHEAIIEKIRKLLAMANPASGASDNERDVAMQMASALMMRHNIEASRIAEAGETVRVEVGEKFTFDTSWGKSWYVRVAQAAALLNSTKLLLRGKGGFVFIGRTENTLAAEMMLKYLIEQVRHQYDIRKPKSTATKWERTNFYQTFRDSCASTIYRRAWDMMEALRNDDAKAVTTTGSTALVVRTTMDVLLKEAEEFMEGMTIKKARKLKLKGGLGTAAGVAAGHAVQFNRAVKKGQLKLGYDK